MPFDSAGAGILPTEDDAERNRVVLAHYPLAVATANKVRPQRAPIELHEDMVQTAISVMLGEWQNFDPALGTSFGKFVAKRVYGACQAEAQAWRSVVRREPRGKDGRRLPVPNDASLEAEFEGSPFEAEDDDAPRTLGDLISNQGLVRADDGAALAQEEDLAIAGLDAVKVWGVVPAHSRHILHQWAHGRTHPQIAAALGMSERTVRGRIAEAGGKLRQIMPDPLQMRKHLPEFLLSADVVVRGGASRPFAASTDDHL